MNGISTALMTQPITLAIPRIMPLSSPSDPAPPSGPVSPMRPNTSLNASNTSTNGCTASLKIFFISEKNSKIGSKIGPIHSFEAKLFRPPMIQSKIMFGRPMKTNLIPSTMYCPIFITPLNNHFGIFTKMSCSRLKIPPMNFLSCSHAPLKSPVNRDKMPLNAPPTHLRKTPIVLVNRPMNQPIAWPMYLKRPPMTLPTNPIAPEMVSTIDSDFLSPGPMLEMGSNMSLITSPITLIKSTNGWNTAIRPSMTPITTFLMKR